MVHQPEAGPPGRQHRQSQIVIWQALQNPQQTDSGGLETANDPGAEFIERRKVRCAERLEVNQGEPGLWIVRASQMNRRLNQHHFQRGADVRLQ